jgi:ELWxxDGT repeat protein
MGGKVYFEAEVGTHGRELWKSNGIEAGTVLVKDISASYLTPVDGTLFFVGEDRRGEELWTTDGTRAGTVIVANLNPGGMTSDYDYGPASLTAGAATLYFTAADDTHGQELWKSDGTKAGTVLVKDIYPGSVDNAYGYPSSSSPTSLRPVGTELYFSAADGIHGRELWKTDGTKRGTVLVKDIEPRHPDSSPTSLTGVGRTLFFTAEDGVHGQELWKSNGTSSGTVMVKDISRCDARSGPTDLTRVGRRLFFAANDGTHGWELWTSDGTQAGTVLVKDINARRP